MPYLSYGVAEMFTTVELMNTIVELTNTSWTDWKQRPREEIRNKGNQINEQHWQANYCISC